jgi:hypothetical protein
MTGKGVVYTHTHVGVYMRREEIFKEEEFRNSTGIGSFSNKTGWCLSK